VTAYDSFRTRQVVLQITSFVAFLIFCGGAALSTKYHSPLFSGLFWLGWVALIVCAFLLFAGSRCPRCQKKMRNIPISCPGCGLNLTSVEDDDKNI
jgi:hypothetical protein